MGTAEVFGRRGIFAEFTTPTAAVHDSRNYSEIADNLKLTILIAIGNLNCSRQYQSQLAILIAIGNLDSNSHPCCSVAHVSNVKNNTSVPSTWLLILQFAAKDLVLSLLGGGKTECITHNSMLSRFENFCFRETRGGKSGFQIILFIKLK